MINDSCYTNRIKQKEKKKTDKRNSLSNLWNIIGWFKICVIVS